MHVIAIFIKTILLKYDLYRNKDEFEYNLQSISFIYQLKMNEIKCLVFYINYNDKIHKGRQEYNKEQNLKSILAELYMR